MYEINNIRLGHVDLDIRVGGEGHHFILTRENDSLVYQAAANVKFHPLVPRKVSEENVLGGGMICIYQFVPKQLQLGGDSSNYGPVPERIMENFKHLLLSEYQKTQLQLEEVIIDLDDQRFRGRMDVWLRDHNIKLNF